MRHHVPLTYIHTCESNHIQLHVHLGEHFLGTFSYGRKFLGKNSGEFSGSHNTYIYNNMWYNTVLLKMWSAARYMYQARRLGYRADNCRDVNPCPCPCP